MTLAGNETNTTKKEDPSYGEERIEENANEKEEKNQRQIQCVHETVSRNAVLYLWQPIRTRT